MAEKTASGDEAAAVAAAIARFEAELGGAGMDGSPTVSRWQHAALLEGVSAKETIPDPGGGARWLS